MNKLVNLVMREILISLNSISLDVNIPNTLEVIWKEPIHYVTIYISHLRRMNFPTPLYSYTTGVWVSMPWISLNMQGVLRRGKK